MERSKDWMDSALDDLEHARTDRTHGFHNWACFSAQQAAEKAVKAVFQRMGAEAWGHSVADLLVQLGTHHGVSQALIDDALDLDKAYIPSRDPNAHPTGSPASRYTAEEARRHIAHAETILAFCQDLLSKV